MHILPRHPALLCAALLLIGCAPSEKKADVHVAAPPPVVLPPFEQEIPSFKATLTLPGAWKYGYRLIERADTTFGAFDAVEFHYTADSARGVPPRLLLVGPPFGDEAVFEVAFHHAAAAGLDLYRSAFPPPPVA